MSSTALKNMYYYPAFWVGYGWFRVTGRTPKSGYRSLRRLYSATHGAFNRKVSKWLARGKETAAVQPAAGLLGSGNELAAALERALGDLRRDGFHVFEQRMPADQVEALVRFAREAECTVIPAPAVGPAQARFDPAAPKGPRYHIEEESVVANLDVQRFMADETLIHLAGQYLEAPPINDLTAMWWSAPADAKSRSAAAQLFHFDMDRLRFIKFFVYLTDVGPHNGPHVVVRGTHDKRPAVFYKDRRFTDEEVDAAFPDGDVRSIEGPAGTILAVDTSALHKGQPLERDHRLLLQVEYTNSLFGQAYTRIRAAPQPGGPMAHAIQKYPHVFQRFSKYTLVGDPAQKSPFKKKRSVRRFVDQLLGVEQIRRTYLRLRFLWLAGIRRRLRVYSDPSKDVAGQTIKHNMKQMFRDLAIRRSDAIIKPLSVIESLPTDARILSIGPRAEGELYNLAANGFLIENIEGLDLISYSPRITLGDMHDMPYDDDAWDAIVSGWAIAYSDDKRKAALEMVRVCKPGGVIGIGVEYNPMSVEHICEAAGYVAGSEERVEDLEQLLALYAPHVDHVYYAHQPTPGRRDRKGSIVAVFSVKK